VAAGLLRTEHSAHEHPAEHHCDSIVAPAGPDDQSGAGHVLMTRYAICRTDASPCQGWFWAGAGCWTKVVRHARTFEFMSDAELNGIAKCPFPLQQWGVVPVESQGADPQPLIVVPSHE
jgi:hypothetical protein